jgi:hypothetical protein
MLHSVTRDLEQQNKVRLTFQKFHAKTRSSKEAKFFSIVGLRKFIGEDANKSSKSSSSTFPKFRTLEKINPAKFSFAAYLLCAFA